MRTSLLLATGFFIGAITVCFIRPNHSPPAPPKGQLVSYQASLFGGHSKIGNVIVAGPTLNQQSINDSIIMISWDTNVVKGSIVIMSAVPIY